MGFWLVYCVEKRFHGNFIISHVKLWHWNFAKKLRNDLRSLSFNYDVFSYVFFLIFKCLKKHQSQCPFKVVKCPNSGCTEKLTKQDLKIHVTFECSWRKVNCEYCQESFVVNQRQVCRLKHQKNTMSLL